jgi:CRISPR/Cas system CSM-associated protein Csm3 (group 7 of RAMP superfamily)
MNKVKMTIKLDSDSLIASGEGMGSIIDTDISFDDVGLPYIPSKRIKGCLRDSILEISKMFEMSKINYFLDIDRVFGNNIKEIDSLVSFSDFYIPDYKNTYNWLKYYKNEFSDFLSTNLITNFFTDIRQQTRIDDDGVVKDNSLRTSRVLKKGIIFESDISLFNDDDILLNTLTLACINLRHIGTSRTRGFGEINCEIIIKDNESLNEKVKNELEKLCK